MKRVAIIDRERCKPEKCGSVCKKVCPINRSGEDCIIVEKKSSIDESLCIGCGICVKKCPFMAIAVVKLPEELREEPIHSYGKNAFRLYRLPAPLPERVVGMLGPNGVGKTTALKIIAGQLKPSIGEWDEIIKRYRGSEVQNHLEKLAKGEITISFKPQEINKIPELYKGKTEQLLNIVNNDMIKSLNLDKIKDRKISELSGGELQRLSIAACLSKEADLYCLDEPGSFNDIKQRILISKIIRNFAIEKSRSVIVVEHDLAMLDMLCDDLHILYGSPGAYGVVSGIKSTRKAVNAYLDGYLAEENVRIRKDAIEFPTGMAETAEGLLLKFETLEKKFPNFSLFVDSGEIRKKEVIGVIGANALGKTTFLKMLAGIEKPDRGYVDAKVKIAYKPQYPKAEGDSTVIEILSESKDYGEEWYKRDVILTLGLQKLMDREIRNLSGGEMQKVAIAVCLGQEADIIAMDEPSAYIDVETRWELARSIKNIVNIKGVSAFIVDHDIQFIDFVSDKIFMFNGEPSVKGKGSGPVGKKEGMNDFLKSLGITCRRDPQSKRPRINKPHSQKDREQKAGGKYYYE